METILATKGLTKHYGRIKAIDDLNLEIKKGSVFGILGPNGSGKTTTLGMVLDVINKTSGSYTWFGQTPHKDHRKNIGAILETPIFYPYLSGAKNLELVCDIKNVDYTRIPEVIDQVNLTGRQDHKFRTYSLGMKQRLSIASALLCNPEVMILDEPTNGLDPQGIADIRQLIIDIAKGGKTIVLASHLLDEVQKVCTDFAVLKNGKLIYTGKVDDVTKGEVAIEVMAKEPIHDILKNADFILSVTEEHEKYLITLDDGYEAASVNKLLIDNGIVASHLFTVHKSLEKQFLEILNESA
ncbi:MAG: ABC transporter ATP-binding protein [Bacteroidetes bacterium]|nr:MAG: ABC transporter ATP-binding protein [Bacteroidota bacterium]